MTAERKLQKRIDSIIQVTNEYLNEITISQEDYNKLLEENSTAKEKFLVEKDNEVYFRNVKLIIKK